MFLSLESEEVEVEGEVLVEVAHERMVGTSTKSKPLWSLVQLSVLTLVFSRCIGAVQWHLRGPSPAPSPLPALLPGGGGTLYNCLYGEAPPERGTFFRPQVIRKGREICHLGL